MEWKWIGAISMFAILLFGLIFSFIFLNSSFDQTSHLENADCVEINKVASLVYDACYDAYTKNIFMDVRREADSYTITELQLAFFDSIEREYVIKDVPAVNDLQSYQIASVRNPSSIDVTLGIVRDFSSPICGAPRRLFIDYCPRSDNDSIGASINPLNGKSTDNLVVLGSVNSQSDSDILSQSLVEKEAAWKAQCESKWSCGDWETCHEGVEKRVCIDENSCPIPTDVPPTNRRCDGSCIENWQCEWSSCTQGGYTTPTCTDLNSCGTKNNLPGRLACGSLTSGGSCKPNIVCGEWSGCEVSYDFLDLSGNSVLDLKGTQTRTCSDVNTCISPITETQACSSSVDVYTKEFVKCGLVYRGIYNTLTNQLIAQIRMGSKDDPSFDISLSGGNQEYCEHCYDGSLNGDEEGIDCGGSCMSCTEKYGPAYSELYSQNAFGGSTPSLIASLLNLGY